jgi:hypothetical protein
VAAAHQVREFAFDFGSGGAVVGFPGMVLLAGAGGGEAGFVVADNPGVQALPGRTQTTPGPRLGSP